ncbi:MAG: sugar porter family MFS transporter [Verrucomicrobiales bacterium]|nr:sugar porter family MFS transporter [Verrucomicrobiales bacterium]
MKHPYNPGYLLRLTLTGALGGFLFGYDTAVINGANQFLKAYFELDSVGEGLASSSAIIGCIPGALVAGFLSDRFGRKRILLLAAALYAISALCSAIPRTFDQFLVARFVGGLGIGVSSMVCPIYIAEVAPGPWRGRLGSLFQLGIVTGIFVTLFVNARIQAAGDEAWNIASGWRWMLGAELVPALMLAAMQLVVPESPRWLAAAGRESEAGAILEKVGGPTHAASEMAAVREVLKQEEGRFIELFRGACRRPLLIAVMLMAFSQFSGINAIMYYSTNIFTGAGVGVKDAFTASVWIGLVNVAFTFVAIAFVDRLGRRALLLVGSAVQVVALGAVGVMLLTGASGPALLATILLFIAAFAVALGPIPWIVCSEIFPTRTRGRAMSVAAFTIWTACYLVAQTFPVLRDSAWIGPARTFWIYGFCSLAAFVFVFRSVPETKGRTLEEIETSWHRPPGPTRPDPA